MSTVTAKMFGRPPVVSEDRLSEAGAAERFARLHGADVRFDHQRQRWLLWDAHRWRPDTDGAIWRLGLAFARTWQRESVDLPDRDRREAVFKAALRLERREALSNLFALARNLHPVADAGAGWDRDPWLLGVPNGVVDLRTGILRAGQRADQITLQAGVAYDPDAQSVRWQAALRTILVADEVIAFLQTAAGYSATGDTRRDVWFLGHGSGRNGKGTVYHPIRRALGDYACELPASVFDARRDAAPYDLAVLPGKRFVVCSEAGDTIRINHDRIKQITGGDPVRAANKYEKSYEFEPVCKLWLAANKKPRVTDDTPAFWARVMLIPFEQSFLGREDRSLRPALEHDPAEQAAILRWLVVGAMRYATESLHPPGRVSEATAAYQAESDPLTDFLEEAVEPDREARVGAADLFRHYQRWAEQQGLSPRERLTATAFGRALATRLDSTKIGGRKWYLGVVCRPDVAGFSQ